MTTISPTLFPENGLRELSPQEIMQRATALAGTLPKDNKPTCSGQVLVGIFFNGTAGNKHEHDHVKPLEKLKETA